ncbi:hypothetical protein [Chryseobacterium nepalense]|uniref:TonB-dependent receptor plug domain-containing protein n=1 Tax=Chryseobacterium nepalense TaxID=1854498 RepID=A0ABY4KB83_9FLAO|nr:hypothetical protein [Chryseobacterium nepalense]UPQ76762.1 hypothetical protein M0D58_04230 [Chryseobacterium nepalense]
MTKKIIFLLSIFMAFCSLHAQGKAEKAITTFFEKYPQEKIHLVFNKNSFVAGENLWFKSFVFDGYNLSSISTSMFVEMYDSNNSQISKEIVPLLNGQGSGSFTLSENLKEGVYYIRAYTTWMSNFSEDFQAFRQIIVYNPSSPEKVVLNDASQWTASVFPESGTLVEGINTKCAVRLQSKGITPSEWSGYVVDAAKPDVKISTFKGFDQNVGAFSLTPKAGVQYQLIINDSKGNRKVIDLPAVSGSGINLQVSTGNDAVKFSLKSKNIAPGTVYKVIGTIGSQIVFKVNSDKILEKTYSIPADQLINGILQLTVFDEKESIIARRLIFVQPGLLKIKKPEIQSMKLNESPRALNSFSINPEQNNNAYTVMVLDGSSENPEDENSFLSTLWLTGDIASKIYKPSQYFTPVRNNEALDALLISEVWKRFDWRTIMSDRFPLINYQPQPYISYKGKVSIQGKPASNAELNLMFEIPEYGSKLLQIKTDDKGFFALKGLLFEDTIKFSYQLNDPKIPAEQVQVIFQPDYSFVPLKKPLPESNYILIQRQSEDQLSETVKRYVATKNTQSNIDEKATLIEEVKLKAKKKDLTKELNEKLSSPLFKSMNETIFDFVNGNNSTNGYMNILQWLQGRVPGLTIESSRGSSIPRFRGSTINVYLDEMLLDPSQINTIPVSDIAMVKVIKGYFSGGFGGGNGAIAIYTKRGGTTGSLSDFAASTKLKKSIMHGFDKEISFVSPNYNDQNFSKISQDSRTTLYWNPYIEAETKDQTGIQFFNNDEAKNFKIIIMGFDTKDYVPIYYNEIVQ